MAYAFMFPVGINTGRAGNPERLTESTVTPSKDLLSRARTVLSHSETLASEVMAKARNITIKLGKNG